MWGRIFVISPMDLADDKGNKDDLLEKDFGDSIKRRRKGFIVPNDATR